MHSSAFSNNICLSGSVKTESDADVIITHNVGGKPQGCVDHNDHNARRTVSHFVAHTFALYNQTFRKLLKQIVQLSSPSYA